MFYEYRAVEMAIFRPQMADLGQNWGKISGDGLAMGWR